MRIAVNTRFLQAGKLEGYGWFVHELLRRITTAHPEHQFVFIFDRPYDERFLFSSNVEPLVARPAARHPLLWKWWYDYKLPFVLKKLKAGLFVSPDGFCSLRTRIPQLTVVHDLAFLHYAGGNYKSHERYYKKVTPACIKKSRKLVTVSQFSKQDIIQQYGTPAEKITVVPNAARSVFIKLDYAERQAVKDAYTDGREYFIYTGSIHPRKNLTSLLKAFSVFKKWQHSDMKLVLCGRAAWKSADFIKSIETYKYRKDLVLTGYVPDTELARLTASAYAMVYPSYFEGFGLPVVEAMQCGVPVVCAHTSALPETGGAAALYADPADHQQIAAQMMLLYKDEHLRGLQVQKGFEQAARFNWDASAALFWQAMMDAAAK
jgi:glycosyltransferase involved in cell wall biosynthesis